MKSWKFFKVSTLWPAFLIAAFFAIISSGCKEEEAVPPSPCDLVECERGECINGICDCPPGFEGPSCNREIPPSRIEITSITVTEMPDKKNNGNTWDIAANKQNPDIWVRLAFKSGGSWVNFFGNKDDRFIQADPEADHSWETNGLTIFTPSNQYRLELLDNDGDNFEQMGTIIFTPYTDGRDNPFPNPMIIGGSKIAFTLEVNYIWD